MESIPPRSRSLGISGINAAASKPVFVTISRLNPLIAAVKHCCRVNPWNTVAFKNAITLEMSITGIVGFLRIDPYKTTSGGKITSGLKRNRFSNVARIVSTFSGVATAPPPANENPAIVYTTIQIMHPGIVV